MLTFWKSIYNEITIVQGVEVHAFTGATGQAELRFPTHTLHLLESDVASICGIGNETPTFADYQRDTVIFLPKNTPLRSNPLEPCDLTTIIIPEHWFRTAMRGRANYDELRPETFETHDDGVMFSAASLLKNIATDRPVELAPAAVESLINSLVMRVMRSACHIKPISPGASLIDMASVTSYIDANIDRRILLDELADVSNMSRSHFAREFKEAANVTSMQYVMERRIAAAKVMLRETRRSLADIALDCGFSSQSHFTTAFRQVTGVTPTAWRTSCG